MSATKVRRRPKTSQAAAPSPAERSNDLRDPPFKALSVIACCRVACASLLEQGGNLEVMMDPPQAAYDLIDATAAELEDVGRKTAASS